MVLLVDLDGFKTVNDQHGHEVGDATLRQAADALRRTSRSTDVCGRLGGDELAVLLTDVDPETARIAGRRLVRAVHEATDGRVTASVGLALGLERADVAGWLNAADDAMYRAKRAGGDRLVEF